MTKAKRTVVFDLDGSLEMPYCSESQAPTVKAWMKEHPTGCAYNRLYAKIEACGVDWQKFERSDCEHWTVPVKYVKP